MKFFSSTRARLLCLVGLLLTVAGLLFDWPLAVVLGIPLWVCLMPGPILGFVSLVDREVKDFYQTLRSREEQVPELVNGVALRMGTSPPKRMRVLSSLKLYASVGADELYISEALKLRLETPVGIGVVAHEIAHMSAKHSNGRVLALCISIYAGLVISAVVILGAFGMTPDHRWLITAICVFLTVLPTVLPPFFRYQEYEADRLAANVVSAETMIHTLKAVGGLWSSWEQETETHPSISKRIARMHGLDT